LKKLILAFLLTAAQVYGSEVTCVDDPLIDTPNLQDAVNEAGSTEVINVTGTCYITANVGVSLKSYTTIRGYDAIFHIGPLNKTPQSKIFYTVVGAQYVKISGGTFRGSRTPQGGLQWAIGIRIDSASNVLLEDLIFENWYTDGFYIGGNPPGSYNVKVRNVRVSNSKRNGLSIACGSKIRIEDSIFETTNCVSDAPGGICTAAELNMPMCGIDFEPNGGDKIDDVRLVDSIIRNNQKCGVFLQSGMGLAGDKYVFLDNVFSGNGTIGLIANQVSRVTLQYNTVTGGTIGYSMGAGLKKVMFTDNEVIGNTGNAINFAGAMDPFVTRNKVNGRPVAYIAITSPLVANGVYGDITIKPFE
jgi:hypothetical protein